GIDSSNVFNNGRIAVNSGNQVVNDSFNRVLSGNAVDGAGVVLPPPGLENVKRGSTNINNNQNSNGNSGSSSSRGSRFFPRSSTDDDVDVKSDQKLFTGINTAGNQNFGVDISSANKVNNAPVAVNSGNKLVDDSYNHLLSGNAIDLEKRKSCNINLNSN